MEKVICVILGFLLLFTTIYFISKLFMCRNRFNNIKNILEKNKQKNNLLINQVEDLKKKK